MAGNPPNLDFKPPDKSKKDPNLDAQPNEKEGDQEKEKKKVIGPRRGSPTQIPEKWDFSNYYKRKFDPESYQQRVRSVAKFKTLNRFLFKEMTLIFQAKFKVRLDPPNPSDLLRDILNEAFGAQIDFLNSMIRLIEEKKDPLYLDRLANGEEDPIVRPSSFKNVRKVIEREWSRFAESNDLRLLEMLIAKFKGYKDARVYPRLGFWQIYLLGRLLVYWDESEILTKLDPSPFFTLLDDLLMDPDVYSRFTATVLLFAYTLVKETKKFLFSWNQFTLIPNVNRDGYLMNTWLSARYRSGSQKDVKFEKYIDYFFNSFGKIPGRAPDMPGGPRDGFRTWLERTFTEMERILSLYSLFQDEGNPLLIEGILLRLNRELESELVLREYDPDGKLISHPQYADYAFPLLHWLQKLSENRESVSNLGLIRSKNDRIFLDQETLRLIPFAIRKLNEKGEKIVQPWF